MKKMLITTALVMTSISTFSMNCAGFKKMAQIEEIAGTLIELGRKDPHGNVNTISRNKVTLTRTHHNEDTIIFNIQVSDQDQYLTELSDSFEIKIKNSPSKEYKSSCAGSITNISEDYKLENFRVGFSLGRNGGINFKHMLDPRVCGGYFGVCRGGASKVFRLTK